MAKLPTSPHIFIHRWYLSTVMSITHRIVAFLFLFFLIEITVAFIIASSGFWTWFEKLIPIDIIGMSEETFIYVYYYTILGYVSALFCCASYYFSNSIKYMLIDFKIIGTSVRTIKSVSMMVIAMTAVLSSMSLFLIWR